VGAQAPCQHLGEEAVVGVERSVLGPIFQSRRRWAGPVVTGWVGGWLQSSTCRRWVPFSREAVVSLLPGSHGFELVAAESG
jgi:hypothetical protein